MPVVYSPTALIGPIEKFGRVLLGPHLKIVHLGDRKTETVGISYSTTVPATVLQGQSRYIRVWVYNSWGFCAHRCQLFLNKIVLDGKILESERSPMHWADFEKDVFEYPNPMNRKYPNGWYVDICSADSVDNRLQMQSLKGIVRGYQKFDKSGIYTLELSAEATKPCWFGTLTLTLGYDYPDWQGITVLSAK